MKKVMAISLLVICNLAAVLAAAAFNVFIFSITGFGLAAAIIIGLFPLCAMGYGLSRSERLFSEKFALKKRPFMLISHIPPIIGAVACWLVFLRLSALGYFSGFLNFGGLFMFLFTVSLSVTAVIYPISSTVWRINTKYI